jgi:hypothetical protein
MSRACFLTKLHRFGIIAEITLDLDIFHSHLTTPRIQLRIGPRLDWGTRTGVRTTIRIESILTIQVEIRMGTGLVHG